MCVLGRRLEEMVQTLKRIKVRCEFGKFFFFFLLKCMNQRVSDILPTETEIQ